MKYRKKPVVIEAYQTDKELDIETLEGTMHASVGDYIITGVRGEQYPCKPDIFEQTYEPADAHTASPWHRVEDGLPDDEVPVLAILHNTYCRNVVLKLCHIGHHKRTTEEYGWQEYEGETEYDEENDCFWIPEGWWESNYHEDNLNWEIGKTDGTITHWMPLPEPPQEENDGN